MIGSAKITDTVTVNKWLNEKEITSLLPNNLRYVKFLWDYKPVAGNDGEEYLALYAIKGNRKNIADMEGDLIADASQVFDEVRSKPEVRMVMNARGTRLWSKLTEKNINQVCCYCLR